jgi:Fic family protein
MVVWELVRNERNPLYTDLEIENTARQFGFLISLIEIAQAARQQWLSVRIITALNYHAIACLHDYAGEYRPCVVELLKPDGTKSDHQPPMPHSVPAQMEHFVHYVNSKWNEFEPPKLAALVLWRLNHIHPFVNGNGRTARAAAYFVACLKLGGPLRGKRTLPELLCDNREVYVAALQAADRSQKCGGPIDLDPLTSLISRLLDEQVASADLDL